MSSLAGKKVVVIGAVRSESGHAAAFRVADWLGLAAAPTFAVMALLSALSDGQTDILCAAMQHASPLGGVPAVERLSLSALAEAHLLLAKRRPRGRSYASAGM
jgi:hypothetical protein